MRLLPAPTIQMFTPSTLLLEWCLADMLIASTIDNETTENSWQVAVTLLVK